MVNSEERVLNLNKEGMDILQTGKQALEKLRQAEKILLEDPELLQSKDRLKLMSITYNNIGCYYKAFRNHKQCLYYLKEALKLELQTFSEPTAIASTQLNICAIYSQAGQHKNALSHATQALSLLSSYEEHIFLEENIATTLVVAHYNAAVEYEYLIQLSNAERHYKLAYNFAIQHLGKENKLTTKMGLCFREIKKKLRMFMNQASQRHIISEDTKRDESPSSNQSAIVPIGKKVITPTPAKLKPYLAKNRAKLNYSVSPARFRTPKPHLSTVRETNAHQRYKMYYNTNKNKFL